MAHFTLFVLLCFLTVLAQWTQWLLPHYPKDEGLSEAPTTCTGRQNSDKREYTFRVESLKCEMSVAGDLVYGQLSS